MRTQAMATNACLQTKIVPCRRLKAVSGNDVRNNDVIVCGNPQTSKYHIIFFGGDVQDYKEQMCVNNPAYDYWDLETTARIIQQKIPDSTVFVIKPFEMYLNTFSMYKNFLLFDEEARPDFTSNCGGISHLKAIYTNSKKLMMEKHNSLDSSKENTIDKPQISLMGFSKGCVVLNQLMFELKSYRTFQDEFLGMITNIHWLDGGHTGGKNAYITDEDTLKDIAALKAKLYVHVTPYQVSDPVRAWIGKEEAFFVDKLRAIGADIIEKRHFMGEPGSILNHFKVLTAF